jgi:hypothetical protein
MSIRNKLVIGLLLSIPAFGQTAKLESGHMVPRLLGGALPTYPLVWQAAHLTGKVVVQVVIEHGRVVNTVAESGNSHLRESTISNIRTWRFDDHLSSSFTVSYSYEIAGEATEAPTNPTVEFNSSLDVKITARPVRPTCNDCEASAPVPINH